MNSIRSFKHGVALVRRLWQDGEFDAAVMKVNELMTVWPGNPQLLVMWASLVQLQDEPAHTLDEAKEALLRAAELDNTSPTATVELGHFLDAVEDDPRAAAKAFQDAATAARRLLLRAVLARAKSLIQLGKKAHAIQCLEEAVYLSAVDSAAKPARPPEPNDSRFLRLFRVFESPLEGAFANEIKTLLDEVLFEPADTSVNEARP